jgi:23S rRNA (cytosine1962-C5)-methyltransferase
VINLESIRNNKLPDIHLNRDLTKHLLRGSRWIFADCFDQKVKYESGLYELKYRGVTKALGVVQGDTQLRFRLLCLSEESYFKNNNPEETLRKYFEISWKRACDLRDHFVSVSQNSFRLISGEGDGLPGLIIDVYGDTAVIKHDHQIMEELWDKKALANLICERFKQITTVYHKRRNDEEVKGENIIGSLRDEVIFLENGARFASNIRDAAKTGFFLDQRDNRKLLSQFSKNKSMLNLFSYTGGFSIFAALGGASKVVSVDIAKNAILACNRNFEVNELKTQSEAIAIDAFKFIDDAKKSKERFDIVVTDPPSFAPNQKALETATDAYIKVYSDSLKLVQNNGFFVASSCSSHITHEAFYDICRESFSKVRKKGTLVYSGGQPFDHPYPLAMEELRYLKFALFRVD